MTIGEVCFGINFVVSNIEIRDKIGDMNVNSAADHGIFCPFLSKWLQNNKTLDFYDLKTGEIVEYKKKHRPLRVMMMDGSVKTALIDDSAPVLEVVDTFCKRIGIANPDEYSLQAEIPADKKVPGKSEEGNMIFF
jgi:talin